MFPMPVIQEGLGLNPALDALFPGEQLSLVPAMRAQGEVVYYVPGNGPGITPVGSAGSVQTMQNEALLGNQQLLQHVSPEGLFMHQMSNGLVRLPTKTLNSIQPQEIIPTQTQCPANISSSSTQTHQLAKPLLVSPQQNFIGLGDCLVSGETPSNLFQQTKDFSLSGTTANHLGGINDKMSAPNLLTFSYFSEVQQSSLDHQNAISKLQESAIHEFGPVEKAIFKQALSVQHSKRSIDSIPSSGLQESSAFQSRGKKQSRQMFDSPSGKGGSTGNRLIGYSSVGNGNTNVAKIGNDLKLTVSSCTLPASTAQSISPLLTSKASKPPVLPSIRYHPYPGAQSQNKSTKSPTYNETNLTPSGPAASQHVTNTANHVHSVSVPREGCYTVTKPTTISQPITESPRDDVPSKTQEGVLTNCDKNSIETLNKPNELEDGISDNSNNEGNISTEIASEDTDSSADKTTQLSDPPSPKSGVTTPPPREVNLPNPLPSYITKIDKPPGRVLKESLHCVTCDVYVNSDNQMKQHINSLRHKNTLQGIPTPAKPVKDEKPKLRADQYRCNVCKVTLNSDIQLSQHLASQRHKNMLEGKPPKPRWSPYDRQQAILHSATGLRLPFTTLSSSPLLATTQGTNPVVSSTFSLANGLPTLGGLSALPRGYLPSSPALPGATHLKQASLVLSDGGMLQAREFVYVGTPQIGAFSAGAQLAPAALPAALLPGQQQIQLQPVMAPQPSSVDWLAAANGVRLAT